MVLFQIALHIGRRVLRQLVRHHLRKARRGVAQNPCLLLQRAERLAAARFLVRIPCQQYFAVRRLVILFLGLFGGPFLATNHQRFAIGVELLQRFHRRCHEL